MLSVKNLIFERHGSKFHYSSWYQPAQVLAWKFNMQSISGQPRSQKVTTHSQVISFSVRFQNYFRLYSNSLGALHSFIFYEKKSTNFYLRRWRSFYNYLLWRILLSIVTSNIQNLFRNLFTEFACRATGILDTITKISDIENNDMQFWKWPVKQGGRWNRIGQLWPEDRPLWLSKFSMLSDLMKNGRKSADIINDQCAIFHWPFTF